MTRQEVWVVTPYGEASLSRVFHTQESAETWFRELFLKYSVSDMLENLNREAEVEDALDWGCFMGYQYNAEKRIGPAKLYTINSFEVE